LNYSKCNGTAGNVRLGSHEEGLTHRSILFLLIEEEL